MSKVYTAEPGKPAIIHIDHVRNDTFTRVITGYNRDGTPYDFTGHTFAMQVRDNAHNLIVDIPNDSFTIDADDNGVIANANNVITILHTKDDFNINPKCYHYDIQLTDADDITQTFQKGKFNITKDSTY